MPSYTSDELIIPDVYAQGNGLSDFEWLQKDLFFSDEYLARVIGAHKDRFSQWKSGRQSLTGSQLRKLKNLSSAMTRLLSFFAFRRDLMMRILEFHVDTTEMRRTRVTPPWVGMSLRNYMLRYRSMGVDEVDSWVQRLRSANSP